MGGPGGGTTTDPQLRLSWDRSLRRLAAPERCAPRLVLDRAGLHEALREGRAPLRLLLPVLDELLTPLAEDTGLVVAVTDPDGVLLHVRGAAATRRRAEDMGFVAGADWSEEAVGTNAPGTALVLRRTVTVHREQHFYPEAHPWSCTAAPLLHPVTGELLGAVDLTGGDAAAAPAARALIGAAVRAARAELALALRADPAGPAAPGTPAPRPAADTVRSPELPPGTRPAATPGPVPSGGSGRAPAEPAPVATGRRTGTRATAPPTTSGRTPAGAAGPGQDPGDRAPSAGTRATVTALRVLGGHPPALVAGEQEHELTERHAEILLALARTPGGLSTAELSERLWDGRAQEATVRAEVLRLRRLLAPLGLGIASRPYRLTAPLDSDAGQVLGLLERGAHRRALRAYPGPLLPRSEAPWVVALRHRLAGLLREAVLTDGSAEAVRQYLALPEAADDAEAWALLLRLLPARSPARARAVLELERLGA
ncbi:GAF domain-containing protein [Kocuria sp. LUK]|uniref:helix-turn-helix domain-containing protein n=1 Tax=Kocuria sp. LUK TaxID=2897828 RepID=UPI001E431262|nr:helix-turn-helix domain-containing protein [Kocuria sp. LUK]MCD1145022.1 GAF domain-containing protein [Kocuria sp. LUK]